MKLYNVTLYFIPYTTVQSRFPSGPATPNHNTRQLYFCFLISYIYCVYQTHTVFTYLDTKYKHKYEQALSIHPNGITCLQTFLKKYTKYWPPKLLRRLSLSPPVKHLTGSKCFKSNSDWTRAFWSKRRHCCCCCWTAFHPLNMYVTVLKHATVKTPTTCCLMAPSSFDQKACLTISRCIS